MKFGEFHLANGHLDDVVFSSLGLEKKEEEGSVVVGRERKQMGGGDEYGERGRKNTTTCNQR